MLLDRIVELERLWEVHGLEPAGRVEPCSAEQLALVENRVAPLVLPRELRELYGWVGGAGSIELPSFGGKIIEVSDPERIVWQLDLSVETDLPYPPNLVPIGAFGQDLLVAEINPASGLCRVWNHFVSEPDLKLFYPSISNVFAAAIALTPDNEAVHEDGWEVNAPPVAATFHPELFFLEPGEQPGMHPQARTICDLSDPSPDRAFVDRADWRLGINPNREPWPSYWIHPS